MWSRTALLVTYDENDGFFDHVVPPYPPSSPARGASTVDVSTELFRPAPPDGSVPGPYGLGQRVPMIVVSPWSRGGRVCSQVFDHTSILQFMERRLGVHEPNFTARRRTVCGDLTLAFNFRRTDSALPALPDTSGFAPPDRDRHHDFVPTPPASPALPRQERGLRPAAALPYDLATQVLRGADGGLTIDFVNRGRAGAQFQVTPATHPNGPWTFTVESGRRLTHRWEAPSRGLGDHDVAVHGPAGFFRGLSGGGGRGPEVSAHHEGKAERVRLTLVNPGSSAVHLTVTDGYGHLKPASFTVRPGRRVEHMAPCEASHGWYDLVVLCAGDRRFVRRLAGHVETRRDSMSDPAIITG